MTAHRHSEMIKAKADNMELVVFHNAKEPNEWTENVERLIPRFREDWGYFLCLPQHKKACLHWLNSGEIEGRLSSGKWVTCGDFTECRCNPNEGMMNSNNEYRIKPKKEKRCILVAPKTKVASILFGDKQSALRVLQEGLLDWQVVEIEVEV